MYKKINFIPPTHHETGEAIFLFSPVHPGLYRYSSLCGVALASCWSRTRKYIRILFNTRTIATV